MEAGCRIFTDCWKAYGSLNDEGFHHYTVNYKTNFKATYTCTATGQLITVHTNRIEGAWKHAKVTTSVNHVSSKNYQKNFFL